MYKIIYTAESEDNLSDIFEFISKDNEFYAIKVLTSIKTTIDILKIFPKSWKVIEQEIRMIVNSDYWYSIIYQIKWIEVYILSISKYRNLFL